MSLRFSLALSVSLALGIAGVGAQLGAQQPAPIKRTELQKQALPKLDFRSVSVMLVEIPPGAQVPKHLHEVAVFGYVLEGTLESQFEGDQPRTYQQGQAWYEPPGTVHSVARNPSADKPVKLLVHYVGEDGKKLSTPMQ